MKTSLRIILLFFCLLVVGNIAKTQDLINLNPDKNGEPWYAGGLRQLTQSDYDYLNSLPQFKIPAEYRTRTLPVSVDNSTKPYFRPIFNQDGGSCGQASGIGYAFTYEQDFARGIAANTTQNQYPTHYTWNFLNGGNGGGSWYFDGWQIINADGCVNVADYGGTPWSGGQTRWLSGYSSYYNGMSNRVLDIYSINVSTPEGLQTLKQWFFDHANGSDVGGVACFGGGVSGNFQTNYLPSGTPEAGQMVVTHWDSDVNHAMTFIGYNDSIRFDYNNDGQYTNNLDINGDGVVDMRDWEIGGVKMANSWGGSWGNGGKAYVMYRTLAEATTNGGIWNNTVHIITTKPSCTPLLTVKATVKHNSRNKIKISAGVSSDISATVPEHSLDFPIFNYQGGAMNMKGGSSEADKTLEFGLDITPLLSYITNGQPAKFFLRVDGQDPNNAGTGQVISFSVIDYTGTSPQEVASTQTNVPINENGTIYLSVEKAVAFNAPNITTNELPSATANQLYSQQLSAEGGLPPYKWDTQVDYSEVAFQGSFPAITSQTLNPSSDDDGFALQKLDFPFPFYGKYYDTLAVSTDGSLLFNNNFEYVRNAANLTATRCITPYGTDLQYYPSNGDAIYYTGDATQATFRWKASLFGDPSTHIDMAVKLYPSGKIEFYYGNNLTTGTNWTAGISNGGGNSYLFEGISGNYQIPNNYMTSFTAPPYPSGMFVSTDGVFSGTPVEANQSWDVTFKVTDYNNISSLKTIPFTTIPREQWSSDPGANNVISSMTGEQTLPKVATHAASGITYISWFSNDNGNYNVRLQKLDVNGNPLWPADGILVSGNTSDSWITDYDMTVDNDTCALITVQDIRTGLNNTYAYRISPSGQFLYGANGIALFNSSVIQYSPKVLASNDGNAIFAIQCFPDVGKEYIKLQKISPTGQLLWGTSGIDIKETTNDNSSPYMINSDGNNFIMVWYKATGNFPATVKKIYAQKFDANGSPVWASPVGVFTGNGIPPYSTEIKIIPDHADGVFVTWHAEVSGSVFSAYVQHVTTNGDVVMPPNGALLSTNSNDHQIDPSIACFDNSGEVYAFWDERDYNQNYRGLYGQRLSIDGNRLWGNTGKIFIPMSISTSESFISARAAENDVVVFYQYYDFGNTNDSKIMAMRINNDGGYVWDGQKIPMCTVQSAKLHPVFGSYLNSQYIAAWEDQRNDDGDVYAQNIHLDGTLGISVFNGYTISGTVTYPNASHTPLSNVAIDLKTTNGTTVATTTTNASGTYSFTEVQEGDYTLSVATSKPWNNVSASDVLLYKKHIANISLLNGIFLASGDVNGNGSLSASDVLLIRKRIAAIINSFSVGDWLFNNQPISVSNSNVTADFNGIVYGDANGSYIPSAKKSIIPQGILSMEPVAITNGQLTIPVHIAGIPDLGAFQFTLSYDAKKLSFVEANNWMNSMDVTVGNPEPGKITFVWAADEKGINSTNATLCNLVFNSVSSEKSDIIWSNNPTVAEFSNYDGTLLQPQLVNGTVGAVTGISELNNTSWSVYPNPLTNQTNISFALPTNGNADISIFNQNGQKVSTVFNGNLQAGSHQYGWNALNADGHLLVPGVYYCRLTVNGQTLVKKIVLLP